MPYGAHYDTALKIFQNNKLFGIGLKNFRIESGDEKYKNSELFLQKKDKILILINYILKYYQK